MNEELVRTLLQGASSRILEGISPQERPAVSAEFEHLLSICIEKIYLRPFPSQEERAWEAGRSLIEEIYKVPPEKRLEHIQRELLVEELSELDASAWEAAETSLKKSPDLLALRAQARAILEKIAELRRVVRNTRGPAWEQDYARTLSEAACDCTFVLGESPYGSFRLARTIRWMRGMGHWPPAWYEELWSQKNVEGG